MCAGRLHLHLQRRCRELCKGQIHCTEYIPPPAVRGVVTGSFLAFLFPTSGYVSEDLGRRGLVLTPVQVRVPAGTTWQSHPTYGTPGSKSGVGKGFLALHSLVQFSVHRDA